MISALFRWFGTATPWVWFIWMLIPVYLGYQFWSIVLPTPPVFYQPPESKSSVDVVKAINESPWFTPRIQNPIAELQAEAPVLVSADLETTTQYQLQGVFMRQKGTSIAIMAKNGRSEVLIQGAPNEFNITLDRVRATEVEITETNGLRYLVKMNPSDTFEDLYTTSALVLRGEDAFVPNPELNLRSVREGERELNNQSAPQRNRATQAPPILPLSESFDTFPNEKALTLPALGSDGSSLSPEAQIYLNSTPRYFELSPAQRQQIDNLMSSPGFLDAIRQDPTMLTDLVDSLPADLP